MLYNINSVKNFHGEKRLLRSENKTNQIHDSRGGRRAVIGMAEGAGKAPPVPERSHWRRAMLPECRQEHNWGRSS